MVEKEPQGPRAQKKAARPLEILEAAFEEFSAKGYTATRVEDIAKRVGVTKGTVYVYFENKEVLFGEMMRHISAPLADARDYIRGLDGPYPGRIEAFVRYVYARLVNNRISRELLRFVVSEGARFPHLVDRQEEEFMKPMFEAAGELIREGVACGAFRPTPLCDMPEILISPALLRTIEHLIYDDRKSADLDAFIEAHIELLLSSLLPLTPSPHKG
ncbi:hypothetical protein BJF93_12720 [Xaviernesmea oryzae]|uniref:HTH tetR-type domain-containing protein n=1 Tax=Xaviernesmea oryzae TaxID=464029 RepID=A0A1Q9AQS7_9HYPH|nr:TetR/AcrR family transcriptional regulator [Xaviernesmea oryzae]OLP57726.1 hypothetical protein BJF93_12720 [Xaviernesmea oryzae]SEM05826.1 transcriptional regulator, TetR family [Xaviernesmea oryzae]